MKIAVKTFIFGALLLAAALHPSTASACSVCMGGSDSTIAPAANGAIFFMIGTVGAMLACLGGFIFHLARRAKSHAQILPDLAALTTIQEEKQHA